MTDTIQGPVINLNGSNARELLEQYTRVAEACTALADALSKSMPHGRDYQTLPDAEDRLTLARRQHVARLVMVESISDDMLKLARLVQRYL